MTRANTEFYQKQNVCCWYTKRHGIVFLWWLCCDHTRRSPEAQAAQSWLLRWDWLKCTRTETKSSSQFFLTTEMPAERFCPGLIDVLLIVTALCSAATMHWQCSGSAGQRTVCYPTSEDSHIQKEYNVCNRAHQFSSKVAHISIFCRSPPFTFPWDGEKIKTTSVY